MRGANMALQKKVNKLQVEHVSEEEVDQVCGRCLGKVAVVFALPAFLFDSSRLLCTHSLVDALPPLFLAAVLCFGGQRAAARAGDARQESLEQEVLTARQQRARRRRGSEVHRDPPPQRHLGNTSCSMEQIR